MTASTAVLLVSSLSLLGSDAGSERAVGRIRDHFARIGSIRVRGVDHVVKAGGLWADDPTKAAPVYDLDDKVYEYDLWIDPPKQRQHWTETRGKTKMELSSISIYFDGTTYTQLDRRGRTGLVIMSGSLVKPPRTSPLHAIGYCFQDTYYTSLAALLADPSKVVTEQRLRADNRTEWLLQIKSLPDDIRPRDWGDKARRNALVKIWAVTDPEVVINQWAVYMPHSAKPDGKSPYGRPIPCFRLDGYNLLYGFINCPDNEPARDELRGSRLPMPRRILHGNGNATWESLVEEVLINPQSSPKSFRPELPSGYSITRAGDDGEQQLSVSGGQVGSAARVREISDQAREMLATGDSLGSPRASLSAWVVPIFSAVLVVGGAALVYFQWKRRKA